MMSLVEGSGGIEGLWTRLAQPVWVVHDGARWPRRLPMFLRWLALPAMLALRIARRPAEVRRIFLFGLAVAGMALLTTVPQLDRVLTEMHLPGDVGGGMASLGDGGVVEAWTDYAQTDGLNTRPRGIARAFLLLDVALVAVYTTLLALVAVLLAGALPKRDGPRPVPPLTDARRATLAIALLLTPFLALADLVENTWQWIAVSSGDPATGLWLLSLLKWVLLATVLAPIVLAAVALAREHRDTATRGIFQTLAVTRFQVVALLAFAGLLFLPVAGPQTADTILRWDLLELHDEVWGGVALTLLLGVTLFMTARRCAHAPERDERAPLPRAVPIVLAVLLLGTGAILQLTSDQGKGLLSMGLLVWVTAFLSLLFDADPAREEASKRRGTELVPALLAVGPLLLLSLAILAATTGQLALYGFFSQAQWVALTIAALVVLVLTVPAFAFAHQRPALPLGKLGATVGVVVAILTAILVYRNPWRAAELVGAVGVVAAFLIVLAAIGWAFVALERRYAPPNALTLANFHRFPILLLLLVGLIGAATFDRTGDHTIRTDMAGPRDKGVAFADTFTRWQESNIGERPAGEPPPKAVPLVFVAASGGGARAAYWTARVLRCVLEWGGPPAEPCRGTGVGAPPAERMRQPLFVASGASGGSLGLASYAARLGAGPQTGDWVGERLSDDYLTPTLAWLLFADLPKAIAGLHAGQDRAEVLERSWEQSWSGGNGLRHEGPPSSGPLAAGLRSSWAADRRLPLLMLNGTSVHDDCRLSASVLNADIEDPAASTADCYTQRSFEEPAGAKGPRGAWSLPATHDLVDYLSCSGADVRLSTAALLSARFPYVSPSGRIAGCDGEDPVHVVDGGYVDNSGASTAVELWHKIERRVDEHNRSRDPGNGTCIVPVFLQIDNDYAREDRARDRKRPYEPFVPLQVFANVRDGNGADARQAAALEFHPTSFGPIEQATVGGAAVTRYAHIYPRAHPGTKAPLGWALSEPSMTSLDRQLGHSASLETVRSWFDQSLTCE